MLRKFFVRALMVFGLATLAACAGSPTEESTGEYIDDTAITTKVKTALARADEVDAMDIQVETFKGEVQLSGYADDEDEKARAEDIARNIDGVKRVKNSIDVK